MTTPMVSTVILNNASSLPRTADSSKYRFYSFTTECYGMRREAREVEYYVDGLIIWWRPQHIAGGI